MSRLSGNVPQVSYTALPYARYQYQNYTTVRDAQTAKSQPVPDELLPDVSGPSGGLVFGGAFEKRILRAKKKRLLGVTHEKALAKRAS